MKRREKQQVLEMENATANQEQKAALQAAEEAAKL